MKLILTSCDFRSEAAAAVIRQHLPPLSVCRVLYFANEKATPEKIRAGIYEKRLAEFGFAPENVTVFDYFAPQTLDAAQAGERIFFILGAAKGKEPFYEQLGFLRRPNEMSGCGMSVYIEKTSE